MAMPDKNKIRKETEQQYNPERNKELSLNNTDFDNQKQSVTKKYKRSMDEAGDAYAPLYSEASVQKYINEKQIAENMANLGLADSGVKDLYREGIGNTYLNTEGRLNLSRQKDISSLSAELSDAVADIENQRALKKSEINSRYDSLINQTAEAKYKQAAAEEEQRRINKELEKQTIENNKLKQKEFEIKTENEFRTMQASGNNVGIYKYISDLVSNKFVDADYGARIWKEYGGFNLKDIIHATKEANGNLNTKKYDLNGNGRVDAEDIATIRTDLLGRG